MHSTSKKRAEIRLHSSPPPRAQKIWISAFEDQMCSFTANRDIGYSFDRVDALLSNKRNRRTMQMLHCDT
jgi:hypothetical protein